MLFVGIDLGTSAVKLLLMDELGDIKNIVSKEYPVEYPQPGWSQQNPDDWKVAVLDGLLELTKAVDKTQLRAIAVAGQMHGLVILDREDKVIRPAILWNDGRTGAQVDFLNRQIGEDKLSAWTSNIAFAGFTAPKLLWLRENEPEHFERIQKLMLPKDYITYILSGVYATDCSDAAGTLLFDVEHRCWSEPMLRLCGLTTVQMPSIFESYQQVGVLRSELAELLGLPKDVCVAAGAGDNAAAAVGMGVVGEGGCNISLGTSGTIFISTKHYAAQTGNQLHSFDHADGGYHLMGCILSAASCNRWFVEDILGRKDYAALQEEILPNRLGKNRVYFLPYLMGERSPLNDLNARGTFLGMTMDCKRADLLQAVLEGVAFALRDCLEVAKQSGGIAIERAKICGGGAKSALWCKIIANVLNLKLEKAASEQGPGMGAAMLAMVSAGVYSSVNEACHTLVSVEHTIVPEPELVKAYEQQYRSFARIYPTVKPLYDAFESV